VEQENEGLENVRPDCNGENAGLENVTQDKIWNMTYQSLVSFSTLTPLIG